MPDRNTHRKRHPLNHSPAATTFPAQHNHSQRVILQHQFQKLQKKNSSITSRTKNPPAFKQQPLHSPHPTISRTPKSPKGSPQHATQSRFHSHTETARKKTTRSCKESTACRISKERE
ncbi:hypothetical protein M758_1G112300 [Ceratodon purpureus]|nr:hypothetical protein M758_1G112300 [Ceratodon purpureus]